MALFRFQQRRLMRARSIDTFQLSNRPQNMYAPIVCAGTPALSVQTCAQVHADKRNHFTVLCETYAFLLFILNMTS